MPSIPTLDPQIEGCGVETMRVGAKSGRDQTSRRCRFGASHSAEYPLAMPRALQFLVLTIAGWVNRQEDLIDYLQENRVLREQLVLDRFGSQTPSAVDLRCAASSLVGAR